MKGAPVSPDPFRFGWRYVQQIGTDGSKEWMQVPLSPEDLLHPQEGDKIVEGTQQSRDRNYLYSVLQWRLADHPHTVVFSDCLIDWGVPDLDNHAPDISVFDGVSNPQRNWKTFRIAKEKARPILTIEVVSPDAHDRRVRDNDVVTKVREYYRAGVPLYFIVDQERVEGLRQVIGYRRGARRYVKMRPDRQGRLWIEPLRMLLGLRDERAVCWDADTGKEVNDLTAMAQERDAAVAALAAAQARIRELEAQFRRNGSQQSGLEQRPDDQG